MSKGTLFILLGGFLFAVLAALLVQVALGGKSQPVANAPKVVEILVASKAIKLGESFSAQNLGWRAWPEANVPPNALVRVPQQLAADALQGKAKREIAAGEPLTKSISVVKTDGGGLLAAALAPGMRAVSLKLSAEADVSGFVGPSDWVDVILVEDVRVPSDERVRASAQGVVSRNSAQTLLENIRVLAVDQATERGGDAKVAKTVTLQVTPRQAEILAVATRMGQVSLALRGGQVAKVEDKAKEATTDLRVSSAMSEILGGGRQETQAHTVRVYNGRNVMNVDVRP